MHTEQKQILDLVFIKLYISARYIFLFIFGNACKNILLYLLFLTYISSPIK